MLKPASVHNCPCCGYPLGILANHNVASMTAARRVILMMLLGMAGLPLLVLAGILLVNFLTTSTVTITPWVTVAASWPM
jgi:hypothetical protein